MSGEINVRLERMLRNGDKGRAPRDRLHRATINASTRESAWSPHEAAIDKVDREVLRAIETELMTDRVGSRGVAREKMETSVEAASPVPPDNLVSSVQADAVEWYRSASAQVEAAAHHNLESPGSDPAVQKKLQHEFLVHMWYVLAQMWRDLAVTSGNVTIAERPIPALPVLDRSPEV